ncbi:MAG: hypothetical protein AAFV07_04445 [Bacteroidota bacterium]
MRIILAALLCGLLGCQTASEPSEADTDAMINTLRTHLEALSAHDYPGLISTIPDSGAFHLILPTGAKLSTVAQFQNMHEPWLAEDDWTMESEILSVIPGVDMGTAIVVSTLREPEREGKPYFHRMYVTYTLRKMDGAWKVVLDQATTIEKSS